MPGGESLTAQLRRLRQEWDTQAQSLSEQLKLRLAAESALEVAEQERDEARAASEDWCRRYADMKDERDAANELTDKIAAELRGVTKERDALARRCAARFNETQVLKAELASATAELARYRTQLAAADSERDDLIAEAIDAAEELESSTIPTSKETIMPATADDGSRAATLLDLPLPDNDAHAATVRDYLVALLLVTWENGPKRPFGNSDWQYEIYTPMVKAGLIPGELDHEGYLEDVDTRAADALVVEAIRALASDRGAR